MAYMYAFFALVAVAILAVSRYNFRPRRPVSMAVSSAIMARLWRLILEEGGYPWNSAAEREDPNSSREATRDRTDKSFCR